MSQKEEIRINTLTHMLILDFSNSSANKNMMSKIWTNEVQNEEICCGKGGKLVVTCNFILFPQFFQKLLVVDASK